MDREINLINYLPKVLQGYAEYKVISSIENEEFNILHSNKNTILNNNFIDDCDAYGIKRYEKMLKIYPREEDTLDTRKFRVKSRWNNSLVVSIIKKLTSLCGENFSIEYIKGEFTINIETHIGIYGSIEELVYILEQMVPCNIIVNIHNILEINSESVMNMSGINTDYKTYFLTCDFNEKYEVSTESNILNSIISKSTIYEIN